MTITGRRPSGVAHGSPGEGDPRGDPGPGDLAKRLWESIAHPRRWREATWAIIAWTALMWLLIGDALATLPPPGRDDVAPELGAVLLIVLWFCVFVGLLAVWTLRRPKR